MEQIIRNLSDPSWWFTGVFFTVIGLILAFLVGTLIPRAWSFIPVIGKKLTRWKERKILIRIKRHRQHAVSMGWLITRYWALAILSLMYVGFVAISFALLDISEDKTDEIKELFPLVIPIYIAQFFVLWEKGILKRAMKAHISWNKRYNKRFKNDAQKARAS